MAPLKVIGTGFGRTGTLSLCFALDILGYPCHHMEKVLLDPTQDPSAFVKASQTRTANWDRIFENYVAAVDWPAAEFWSELVQKYPDAKVILTIRDPEDWYASVANTINEWPMDPNIKWPMRMLKTRAMARAIVKEGVLRDFSDKEAMIAKFNDNIERVKQLVPQDRLLIFHVGDGWGPLCRFLKATPPDTQFPRCNRGSDFVKRLLWVKKAIESGRNLAAM
ncbi:hypothetical protein TOPH_07916 [Tolypocladium ophioglossoides CBS 100239]|uniref:NAD dependent epimerase/dehydratase n=1 Tax=Tolypocladium ophioglossoides (strain CBS 100239) TaxID=1163406 RepID=A0A0L0N005_TOLOC|nr:hypothetical protein TOPH_07916 [Tolypocladium ophioglossoides CBS 100239]